MTVRVQARIVNAQLDQPQVRFGGGVHTKVGTCAYYDTFE
jgi:hypothetical protein